MRGILGLMVGVSLAASGCGGSKPGDTCNNPECDNDSTAFFCDNGVYVSVPCRGPQGCTTMSDADQVDVICDESLDVAGDNCGDEFAGAVDCTSATTALVCGGNQTGANAEWTDQTCTMPCVSGQPGSGVCQ